MAKHAAVTDSEPAVVVGLITAVVTAVVAVLVAFGVDLTTEQQVAILGLVAAVAPIVAAILTRGRVTPAAAVAARVDPDSGYTVAGPAARVADGQPVTVEPTAA